MVEKKTLTVFLFYAHQDEPYIDVFTRDMEKFSNPPGNVKWKTCADKDIPAVNRMHDSLRRQAAGCDFAIVLVSENLLKSRTIDFLLENS